ncbi:MAG: energy-coupling factor transporter transmembrane component T family protein [Coriobacteriales bacterium]
MDTVFSYVPGTSVLHRMNPVFTFLCAFLVCIAAAVSTNHLFVLALIVVQLLLSSTAGVFRQSMKLVLGLGSLALIVLVLQVIFVRTGTVFATLGPLMITSDGLLSGVLVVLKVVCMVLPLSLAFMVTPMNDLTNELVSKCHLPYKYAFTFTTAVRFIPLFMEEMSGIMEAQKARGVQFDTRNIARKFALMVPLTVPLLVSSVKKTDTIAIGAELRGFSLRGATSAYHQHDVSARDIVAVVVCVAVLAAAIALNVL